MKEKLLLMLMLFSLLFVASCTEVELCDEPDHPHRTGVKFDFDWTNVRNSKVTHDEPDSMFIIAKRIIGTWKCEVKVNSQNGEGYYVWNAPQRKSPAPTVPEEEADEDEFYEPDNMESGDEASSRRDAFVGDGDEDDNDDENNGSNGENGSNEEDPEPPSTPENSTPPQHPHL